MLKRIFVLVVIAAFFFVVIQFASVFFYAWQFDDFANDEVKYAPLRETTTKEHFVSHLIEQGHFYGLDIDPGGIAVEKNRDGDSGITTLAVDVNYTVPVDLYYFTFPLKRHFHTVTRY